MFAVAAFCTYILHRGVHLGVLSHSTVFWACSLNVKDTPYANLGSISFSDVWSKLLNMMDKVRPISLPPNILPTLQLTLSTCVSCHFNAFVFSLLWPNTMILKHGPLMSATHTWSPTLRRRSSSSPGPEFGEQQGHTIVIKSSSPFWHEPMQTRTSSLPRPNGISGWRIVALTMSTLPFVLTICVLLARTPHPSLRPCGWTQVKLKGTGAISFQLGCDWHHDDGGNLYFSICRESPAPTTFSILNLCTASTRILR